MVTSTALILVANASEAFLYSSTNLRTSGLNLLKQLSHPESRMKACELVSDDNGSFTADTGNHGAFEKSNPKKVEAEHFAIMLAREIEAHYGAGEKRARLVIVAPAHFGGAIKKHLNVHVQDLNYIAKDYTKYKTTELLETLRSHIFE